MPNVPEIQWRFGERYLVTDFIQHQNVAVKEIASSLPPNNQDEFVLAASVHIRDSYYYPLDDAKNPSTSGQLLRYRKGLFSYHFKKCLTPETKIFIQQHTGRSYKEIKDVKVGDYVFTHLGNIKKVTEVIVHKIDENIITLHLNNGEMVNLTQEHPVYTIAGWVEAKDLTTDSILYKAGPLGKQEGKIIHCLYCDTPILVPPSSQRKFCSNKCSGHYSNKQRVGKTHKEIFGAEIARKIELGAANWLKSWIRNNIERFKRLASAQAKERWSKPEYKELFSSMMKRKWQDEAYISKVLQSRSRQPNKLEVRLADILTTHSPNEWKFVGDNSFWIEKLNPDFININGKKLLIELLGCWWHGCPLCYPTSNNYQNDFTQRKAIYARYGYDTLPIWEHEMVDEVGVLSKVATFTESHAKIENGTRILKIEKTPYKGSVYNLEVEDDHSFAGKGIIFHNCESYVWALPCEVINTKCGYCAETANLATSLLIAGGIPNSWVVLGEVRTAKDDRLLGYHAWSETPYLGAQNVMETTVDEKDVNVLAPISSAYDRQSQWAQNANLYYLPQSRYNATEYIGEGPLGGMMVQLIGLPAKRVLLLGLDKTLVEKPKRLRAEYQQEARLIKRLLLEAYRGG